MAPVPYRSTPVFNETSLPQALRSEHRTKAGVWGVITILAGEVRLTYAEPASSQVLTPERPGLVLPEQTHFVTPLGTMQMRVDFYDCAPAV